MNYPGKCEPDTKEYPVFINRILNFTGTLNPGLKYADVGPANAKTGLIKKLTGIKIDQVYCYDFNRDCMVGMYDVVFCFEILEHLQNQLHFMEQLRNLLAPYGKIFLTTPHQPKWMQSKYHYHEISPDKLKKWLIDEVDLKLIRWKKLRAPYRLHNFGIRPLLRKIFSSTYIYEIQ